jgi:rare lipoprotein A (peptidoglycan hydrolase)
MSLRSLPALFCLTRLRTASPGGQGQTAPPRASATSLRPRPATTRTTATLGLIALLAGCASTPPPGERDGPPLKVLGRRYVPFTDDRPLVEHGLASWYGRKFHGRPTSNGEPYDMFAMTAAHKTMPIPSYARVRNPANGREIIVRVNDRGPFVDGRIIDLSYVAALRLGVLNNVAPVQVRRLTTEEIRSLQGSAERARALLDP